MTHPLQSKHPAGDVRARIDDWLDNALGNAEKEWSDRDTIEIEVNGEWVSHPWKEIQMAYLYRSYQPEQAGKFLEFLWMNTKNMCHLGCPLHDSDTDTCLADPPRPCLELGWILAHLKIEEIEA